MANVQKGNASPLWFRDLGGGGRVWNKLEKMRLANICISLLFLTAYLSPDHFHTNLMNFIVTNTVSKPASKWMRNPISCWTVNTFECPKTTRTPTPKRMKMKSVFLMAKNSSSTDEPHKENVSLVLILLRGKKLPLNVNPPQMLTIHICLSCSVLTF